MRAVPAPKPAALPPAATHALASAALLFAVGCSANVMPGGAEPAPDAEATPATLAVVVVERTGAATEPARAEAVARFVRVRGGAVDDDALRMVGAAVDLPALGTCAALESLGRGAAREARRSASATRPVELLDVGAVTLEANGLATALAPRRLPDVSDLVSGVVYARAAEADALPARARYELRIGGLAGDPAPSAVAASAPAEPADVRLAGQDPRLGPAVLPPSGAVELTWEPGTGDELVYVDVSGAPPSTGKVRCSFQDSGRATLSASVLAPFDDGSVAVHRVRREALRVRGVDAGEIRFDFARVVAFARR